MFADPRKSPLGNTQSKIMPGGISSLLASLNRYAARTRVDLKLPRFRADFKSSLVQSFQHAGLKDAFDKDKADFSGVTGRPPADPRLWIDDVVHRAVIEVAETGTEAAAATAVGVAVAAMPVPTNPPVPFAVDRPFLFYVVDDSTGAILFQGRIVDPR